MKKVLFATVFILGLSMAALASDKGLVSMSERDKLAFQMLCSVMGDGQALHYAFTTGSGADTFKKCQKIVDDVLKQIALQQGAGK